MTMDELLKAILTILPEATLGEDNEGQILIYTNLKEDNGNLISMDEENE